MWQDKILYNILKRPNRVPAHIVARTAREALNQLDWVSRSQRRIARGDRKTLLSVQFFTNRQVTPPPACWGIRFEACDRLADIETSNGDHRACGFENMPVT